MSSKKIKNYQLLSLIRPSNASLFLNCTKALEWELIKPKTIRESQKEIMATGTEKHKTAELILKNHYEYKKDISDDLEKLEDNNLKKYIETLIVRYPTTKYNVRIEKSIPIPFLNRYGTVDFLAFNENELHIIDLKTGFVEVEAWSKQNIIYAISMLTLLKEITKSDIEYIYLGIFQNSKLNIMEIAKESLYYEYKEILKTLNKINNLDLSYKVGYWCGWCSNKSCEALRDKATNISNYDVDPTTIKEFMELEKILKAKIKTIKEDLQYMEDREVLDYGFKKFYRSTKVINDKDTLLKDIISNGDFDLLNISQQASKKYNKYFTDVKKPYFKATK
jgi:hypothetical protein